jgi:UDP-2,4-diacetamido-2,4,6-trideoxy-beta-L-altropyranose hydrolase
MHEPQRVLIRADAGETIGAGHLMRCVALAEGFRDHGVEPVFVTRTRHAKCLETVKRRGFDLTEIPNDFPMEDEGTVMAELDPIGTVTGLVVDRYGLPKDYFVRLRAVRPTWTLAHIDDLGHLFDGVDLVVNQNIWADETCYAGATAQGTLVLAGSRYTLLRTEFRKRPRPSFAVRPAVCRILLTLGGSDPYDRAVRVLSALDWLDPRVEVDVVEGPGFRNHDALDALASSRASVRIHVDLTDMYELMRHVDLSINGSGSTLWELYYLGVPTILYVLADNQAAVAERAHALGCSLSLGPIEPFDPRVLREAVERLMDSPDARRRMSRLARQMVDGLGVERVTNAFLAACRGGNGVHGRR